MGPSNPAPSSRSDDAREVRHFQWGLRFHETCQYNFFCDDKFFCVRLIEVRGFRHQSAWVYDGEVRELLDAADVIERDGDDHLKIRTPRFLMESDDAGGAVTVLAESGSPGLEMRWTTPILSTWFTPGEGSARHEPLKPIEAEVEEMGLWKTKLLGEDMDCLLRQGFRTRPASSRRPLQRGHAPTTPTRRAFGRGGIVHRSMTPRSLLVPFTMQWPRATCKLTSDGPTDDQH